MSAMTEPEGRDDSDYRPEYVAMFAIFIVLMVAAAGLGWWIGAR